MKTTMKSLLMISGLLFAVAVSAQEPAPAAKVSDFHEGDTVVIRKDQERYLTGEKMSKWVYKVPHTVQQAGGRRFPEGVLLRGIFSWVAPEALINQTTHPEAAAAEQEAKQEAIEQAKRDEEAAKQERKDSIANAKAEAARQDSIAKVEQAKADSIETAAVVQAEQDSIAQEQARQDSIAKAVQDSIDNRAYRDSVAQATRDSLKTAWEHQQDSTEAAYIMTKQQKEIENCNRFTIGIRGGAASLMHKTENNGKWSVGFDALLDLQYAHYWKKFGKKMQYGLLLGVGVGYARSALNRPVNDSLTISTTGGDILYHITTDNVKEADGELQLEIPLMFSMIHEKGFFMNIGPRFMLPVYAQYNQTIDNPVIDAYFATEGVNVHNARITGQVTDEQAKTNGKWKASTLNIMLGAELGYEFTFRNKNALGIGLYADYSVYTLYKNEPTAKSLVSIAELPGVNKPAVVNVLSATDSYAKGLGFFDVGLKLAYHFNWWKEK